MRFFEPRPYGSGSLFRTVGDLFTKVLFSYLGCFIFRFLNDSFKHIHDESGLLSDVQNDDDESKTSERELIKIERQALQEAVSEIFVNLCGSDNEVRECLFSADSLTKLCDFFGNNRSKIRRM